MKNVIRQMKKIAIMAVAGALAGCVAMPSERMSIEHRQGALDRYDDSWFAERPAVSRYARQGDLVTKRSHPIPGSIARQRLSFELTRNATLEDLVEILNLEGISVKLNDRSSQRLDVSDSGTSEEPNGLNPLSLSDRRAGLRRFNGTVGELATTLRELLDVEIEFRGGHLVIRHDATYYVQVPQSQGISQQVMARISELGALDTHGDVESGLVTYRASPEVASRIDRYIRGIAANAATVHLQVAVISVRMEERRRQGIDWGSLAMRIGDIPGLAVEREGRALVFSSRELAEGERSFGLGANIERANFGLQAVLDALSQYGETSAEQDVTLATLAGSPVRIESGQEIPYVGELGAAFQGGQGGGVFGQATVESVNVGLDLTMTPRFDANSELVTTNIDLQISELVAIREFEAGGGGILTAPELQILNFSNISRLRPGQVTLLGGVSTTEVDNTYTTVTGMERRRFGGKRTKSVESAIFIMLRPTITLYSDLGENEAAPKPGDVPPCWNEIVLMESHEHARRISSVFFAHGEHELAREQRHHVWSVTRGLKDNERLALVAYADPTGDRDYNTELRSRRQQAVFDLVAPLVPSVRTMEHTPLHCDETGQGVTNPYQRRVEIWVIGRKEPESPRGPEAIDPQMDQYQAEHSGVARPVGSIEMPTQGIGDET